MLAVYAGLLILIAIVIGAASVSWLTSGGSDRLAVIANLLSLGTLLLALVAGIVASRHTPRQPGSLISSCNSGCRRE